MSHPFRIPGYAAHLPIHQLAPLRGESREHHSIENTQQFGIIHLLERTQMSTCTLSPLAELPDFLTVEETAALLRVGRGTAYQMIRRGEIPSAKMGRRFFVSKAALLRTIEGA